MPKIIDRVIAARDRMTGDGGFANDVQTLAQAAVLEEFNLPRGKHT